MKTIFLAATSFVALVLAGDCRSSFSEKAAVWSVGQKVERVYIPKETRAMWKIFSKLSRTKLEELAERYVHATDWLSDWENHVQLIQYFTGWDNENLSKFRREYKAKYGHEYPAYLENPPFSICMSEIIEKEPVWSILKPLREDKELAPLINSEEGREVLSTEFLDVVAKYYICKHPERKDGWNLLWVFAQENIEEAPYCMIIEDLFQRYKLYRYPYGKIMWPEIKNEHGPKTKL